MGWPLVVVGFGRGWGGVWFGCGLVGVRSLLSLAWITPLSLGVVVVVVPTLGQCDTLV